MSQSYLELFVVINLPRDANMQGTKSSSFLKTMWKHTCDQMSVLILNLPSLCLIDQQWALSLKTGNGGILWFYCLLLLSVWVDAGWTHCAEGSLCRPVKGSDCSGRRLQVLHVGLELKIMTWNYSAINENRWGEISKMVTHRQHYHIRCQW